MKETVGKTTNPDYIFETSWEVCNKVGGIYTVLSSRAKTMQDLMADKVFFIGPDLGQGDEPTTDFHESHTLMAKWRETLAEEGLKCRIGRWNVPGQPVAILVDFTPFFAQKDEIYAKAWDLFQVDSLHAYGDYDEASMFSYAAGRVAECLCRKCLPAEAAVVYQAHEWMSGLGMLFLKHMAPRVATIFTTHATSIGRSIAGNNKLLYEYFPGYDGDQMAAELNMQSKHSIEKQSAHRADCFTTVSTFTARECEQLLDKAPDVVLPNGFEADFVPRGSALSQRRRRARQRLFHLANCLTGLDWADDTLVVSTSGRNDFRCKGFDVFIDALANLRIEAAGRNVLALIEVPCWVREPRKELVERMQSGLHYTTALEEPTLTHWLNNMDDDRILGMLRQKGLAQCDSSGRLNVLFIPCYLDGADGILDMPYYDVLTASDLCVYPSYYEPWGYTPLEAIAFHTPCVTTDLSGFGQWVDSQLGRQGTISDSVAVLHRTDLNYFDVVHAVAESVQAVGSMTPAQRTSLGRKAAAMAEKAQWKHFINHYCEAYAFALRKTAQGRQA